jgi:hypothetical protein
MMNQKPKVTIEHDGEHGWLEVFVDNLAVYRGPESLLDVYALHCILDHLSVVEYKGVTYQ